MLLKKKTRATMEDHGSLLYRDMVGKQGFFDEIDYEVSSILLELSHPVVFSSDPPLFHKWGRTKKRSSTVFLRPPKISPPCAEVAERGSTSSSSCLTGDAKKTYPQSLEAEDYFSAKSIIVFGSRDSVNIQTETGLIRAQVGSLLAQPIGENLPDLQPLTYVGDPTDNKRDNSEPRGFDLNLPAEEEGNLIATTTIVDFESAGTKAQAAAQARQMRLGLIRSKKRF
ncbi:hypothetical protein F2Q69_00051676 [Brassica cretica]|uniref:Uncharacterized protein n=1 Tax=Brassica cretica TaxID=69181 RepID=A0A8S9PVU8_BRACR|nr:hypothetical protein F2Q69_00051676 [Brassica cretica]